MKKTKLLSLIVTSVMAVTLLAGCGNKTTDNTTQTSSKPVKITFLNSKSEVETQLEDAAKAFTKENPSITLEIIPVASGTPFQTISSMYSAGNAPTLAMLDPSDMPKFTEKFLDLSDKKWVKDAVAGSLDAAKVNGKYYGFPFAIEGYGLIYNKSVLDKAGVDPTTIKTQDALKAAFDKIQASGTAPIILSPLDWSLAAHYLPIAYSNQDKDPAKVQSFLTDLKAGKVDLANNTVFNGLIKTLDIIKQYNVDKATPLTGTYDRGQQYIATGKAGFWFMGNWAWPQMKDLNANNSDFGFIPVPTSNNASDWGNSQVTAGPSKFIGIDKVNNNADQQAAAEKFLEWIIYSNAGQDFLVNKCSAIPAFKNITLPLADPLGRSIKKYIDAGNIIPTITNLPSDHWSVVGASMQKYVDNKVDKAGLAAAIQDYWKNVK